MIDAEMDIVRFQADDIMTASGGGGNNLSNIANHTPYYASVDDIAQYNGLEHIYAYSVTPEKDQIFTYGQTISENGYVEFNFEDEDEISVGGQYDSVVFTTPGFYALIDGVFRKCEGTDHWHPGN